MPEMEGVHEPMGRDCFSETVCIDAMRIYDSCSDKDCLEDIRVLFPPARQPMIDSATNVRIKEVSVITVYLDLQPIPFNKGFYSVDMTFFFDVAVELFSGSASVPVPVNGVAVFNKKVVLYGSEGNVKVFSSEASADEVSIIGDSRALPTAYVQVAEPVALSAKLCGGGCSCEPYYRIPEAISQLYGGELDPAPQRNNVYVTIGLFTIVQIVRSVPMTVPASEFCVPEKECVPTSDNPCELFRRIDFPVGEFFPPRAGDCDCGCSADRAR
ncbi:hypothetical protein [Acutalibacter muris]|nr:hypothetical protein [Acutalibacter muris]